MEPVRPDVRKAKVPADAIGNAVVIAKIAIGEIDHISTEEGETAAVALGWMGLAWGGPTG
jgi:hypothetical protein